MTEPSAAERAAARQRPRRVPAGFQAWRRLVFLHWPVAPETLRPHVPAALPLDLYQGTAWLSLAAFSVQAARPLGLPRGVGLDFLETNVRTYVHLDGRRPGVYFFSLDASSLLAVLGARASLGLPYMLARGYERWSPAGMEYELRRCAAGAPAVHLRYQTGASLAPARPETLDFFLIERYWLHLRRGRSLWSVQVHHRPYPLQAVRSLAFQDRLIAADGLPEPQATPVVHFSPGVDVAVFPPSVRRLA